MSFNAKQFCTDYNIHPCPEKKHKHIRPGWLQIHCPFCPGPRNWHLGFNISRGYTNCWRCGWHSLANTIHTLLECNWHQTQAIIKQYSTGITTNIPTTEHLPSVSVIKLPSSCGPLTAVHRKYLKNRHFNPDKLIHDWQLVGTQHVGNYKWRIIAPVYLNSKLVSYQGRDITGKSSLPYMACPTDEEVVHHKHTLYGIDYVVNRKAIIVEGIVDAWRMGRGTVATFGTGYTREQLLMMVKWLRQAFVLYDAEPEAQEIAQQLTAELYGLGIQTENICLGKGDPGDLPNETAAQIKRELLG